MRGKVLFDKLLVLILLVIQFPLSTGCHSLINQGSSRQLAAHSDSKPLSPEEMRFGLARLTERNSSLEEALIAYKEVLELEPDHTGALHRLGVVSMKQGRADAALNYLERAMAVEKPDVDLLGDYGYALFLAGDYELAREYLELANQKQAGNQRIVNNLALTAAMQGDQQRAFDLFRSVSSEAEAHASLGFAYAQQGMLEEASDCFHLALEANPGLQMAANGLLELHQYSIGNPSTKSREQPVTPPENQAAANINAPIRLTATPVDERDDSPR